MGNFVSISGRSTLIGTEPPATVRAPEIEPGVGCNFDSYLLVPDNTLHDRIAAAKARLGEDVVILGHHYQRDEVIQFADFRGDSSNSRFRLRKPTPAISFSAASTSWPKAQTSCGGNIRS